MTPISNAPQATQEFELSLFCGKEGDAWRIRVWPGWLPAFLRDFFDEEGEAYPVLIDLEELDREMKASSVSYERRESPIKGFELMASGAAATVMAHWLARSFSSGRRELPDPLRGSGDTTGSGMTG